MVPVAAPRFDLRECNTESERIFVEALHARAIAGGWYADSWRRPDRVILSVDRIRGNAVVRTLRVDFDGVAVLFGDDETHQFVTDLDPALGTTRVTGRPPAELAGVAADWLEREMAGWQHSAYFIRALGAAFGLCFLAAVSFVGGIVIGLVDRFGAENKPALWSYGFAAAKFGLLILACRFRSFPLY
jgi:hypothetical protein